MFVYLFFKTLQISLAYRMFSVVAHLKKLHHTTCFRKNSHDSQMLESTFGHSALLKIKFREKGKVFTEKVF